MTNVEATTAGNAAVTPQGATVAPAPAKGTTKASQKKVAPKAKRGEKPAAAKTAPANRKETAPKQAKPAAKGRKPEARDGSKKSAVIELLRRKEGATSGEIAKVTKWQPHTIRGFISGTISKKMKLAVESVRNEQGERVYKVK
jgi:hypothetical protein